MAFTPSTLSVILQTIGGVGMRFVSYRSDDPIATLTDTGYFASGTDYGLRLHDLIFVSSVSGSVEPYVLVVTAVDSSGNVTAEQTAFDALLTMLAGLTPDADKIPYFTSATTAGLLDFKDEDDMASDSATAVPSQQSVKAYADANGSAFSKASNFGAVGDGVADDLAGLDSFAAGANSLKILADGTYNLSSDWSPDAANMLFASGDASFPGVGRPDFNNLVPFQGSPGNLWSKLLVRHVYGDEWLDQGNIFQVGSFAQANVAGVPVVAVFGEGEAAAANSSVWGGNFVAYANNATGTSIGIELNCGTLVSGGDSYGLVIASAGGYQAHNAIQIQSNTSAAQFIDGIRFNFRDAIGAITDNVIRVSGTSNTALRILFANGVSFTAAEIDIPSFVVEATQGAAANKVQIRGGDTGGTPRVTFTGSDTNVGGAFYTKGTGAFLFMSGGVENFRVANVNAADSLEVRAGTGAGEIKVRGSSTNSDVLLSGKGTGGVRLSDGAGAIKIRVNTTGVGFFGTAPAARAALAAPTGTVTRTTFDTSTVTTAELAERVAAMITDLRAFGLFS